MVRAEHGEPVYIPNLSDQEDMSLPILERGVLDSDDPYAMTGPKISRVVERTANREVAAKLLVDEARLAASMRKRYRRATPNAHQLASIDRAIRDLKKRVKPGLVETVWDSEFIQGLRAELRKRFARNNGPK